MGLLFLEVLFSTWKLAKKGYRHLAECNGMYKLNSFIMPLEKNQRDRTHVRKSCLRFMVFKMLVNNIN